MSRRSPVDSRPSDVAVDSTPGPRPRRVWWVNHYAGAPDGADGTRSYDLARGLVARGMDVTIFAAGWSHATGREERLCHGRLVRTQWFDGVRFVWLRTTPYEGNTSRRRVNMLSYVAVFLAAQIGRPAPDTVIGSTVHPFAAFAAWLVARRHHARFVFEIQDLWPQTLIDLGAMRRGSPGERLLRFLESFLVKRADAVVTVLPGTRDYLVENRLPADHVVYVPNGVDRSAFDPDAPDATDPPAAVGDTHATIMRMRAEGRFVIGYVGTLGYVNGVDVVVEAARIAEEREPGRIGLVLVGDGPERAEIAARVAGSAVCALQQPVGRRFVPMILKRLDATVVHATWTPVYRYGMSFRKLFEYMAMAKPVIFAAESVYDPVADERAGVTLPPDDPERLAAAYLQIAHTDPDELERMGRAGHGYVARTHDTGSLAATVARVVDPGA